ncbi:hypothetical protein [Kitasatospora sp. CB01950]|uniref:hypothetical protein n=1 Tax=Kitasatospora sp. CB01950 TaxID=1703930 RepID=UPI00093A1EAB|nr:hypothetical protein [Kitasatospora sp. CB01950]OKJ16843.1 hypothetical protein AMK19_01400 [Kitasatospora sp. CB01950]
MRAVRAAAVGQSWSSDHWHLLEDAPDLTVWAVARQLPFDRLHCDQHDPAAPAWEEIYWYKLLEAAGMSHQRESSPPVPGNP